MKVKFLVKRRSLHPAKRNPFRPKQRVKRGKWTRFAEFDTSEEAKTRADSLRGGMTEVGIWHRGVQIAGQNKYTGEIEWLCICIRSCDCQDERIGLTSNECPVHNDEPQPHPECLAAKHWFQKVKEKFARAFPKM